MVFSVRYPRLLPGYGFFGNNGNYLITVYRYSEIPKIPVIICIRKIPPALPYTIQMADILTTIQKVKFRENWWLIPKKKSYIGGVAIQNCCPLAEVSIIFLQPRLPSVNPLSKPAAVSLIFVYCQIAEVVKLCDGIRCLRYDNTYYMINYPSCIDHYIRPFSRVCCSDDPLVIIGPYLISNYQYLVIYK